MIGVTCGVAWNNHMKYVDLDVVLQEIPGEISLAFTITGCSLRCDGCHSRHTWNKNKGDDLTVDTFQTILNKYLNLITCVVFFGGEWYEEELIELLQLAQSRNLKTALYTGLTDVPVSIKQHLTFLKTGPYKKENGGLASPGTNQRLVNLTNNEVLNTLLQP